MYAYVEIAASLTGNRALTVGELIEGFDELRETLAQQGTSEIAWSQPVRAKIAGAETVMALSVAVRPIDQRPAEQ